MAYSLTATLDVEVAKLSGSHPINLFVLNASLSGYDPMYYAEMNQSIYGYAMSSDGTMEATLTVYNGLPITRETIKTDLDGGAPEVRISIPNVDRVVEAVIQSNNYLRGRDITCLTTFGAFLPASSTDYRYIGTTPDKNAVMKEKFYIDSVTSDENVVSFNCKQKFALQSAVLPRRRFTRECSWTYLGSECNFSSSINSASYPTCDYTLEQCRERGNSKRYGGFVGIPNRGIGVV